MLTTDDFYDILSTNERLLEENRRVLRLATEAPRNVELQERYLQQAAKLGLIPARFSSPARPSPSKPAPKPLPGRTSVPASTGHCRGRTSHDRVIRELVRAGSTQCNPAAAALAVTEALYHRASRDRPQSGGRASGSSDSESSKDSLTESQSSTSSYTLTVWQSDAQGKRSRSVAPDSRSRNRVHSNGGLFTSWLQDAAPTLGGSDGGVGRGGRSRSPRRERGSAYTDPGDGGGGSRGVRLLREPTPSFLRRWKVARKRKNAKKQVVRFLLRTSDELGEVDGTRAGEATSSGGGAKGAEGVLLTRSGGGAGPGVVIAYPGSSVLFPPAALPYSLAEALEAVRQQAAQLQLGGNWHREREWTKEEGSPAGGGGGATLNSGGVAPAVQYTTSGSVPVVQYTGAGGSMVVAAGRAPGGASGAQLQPGPLHTRAAAPGPLAQNTRPAYGGPPANSAGSLPSYPSVPPLERPGSPGPGGSEGPLSPLGAMGASQWAAGVPHSSRKDTGGGGMGGGMGSGGGGAARAGVAGDSTGGVVSEAQPFRRLCVLSSEDVAHVPAGSPAGSASELVSEVSEAAEAAAAVAAGPAIGSSAASGNFGDLQLLREQQSAIFRDVQVLMQRLAELRGRLGP
ncbi:hypothetical protein VOLCADRAFT_87331 [Volvox carteri f. nagariensis]|uniref:Uncharacterized protein n=1 Tax=Volvox carteri f. nagariensis TaxID=3068 RepID=D8TL24_VOLCA|nr:uncharacterized protein VOLCADRAFT_87331 [Volvox carteri f. nagariensis]EFJ51662.1 hypothetical protein VOLCADRAFT_87331 [Volvox carteri f. nagariensis]|eukprot:XP_002947072.1 hypothetical protein VOLCADRAFT_87331 [Volvox carteri f. nagariensis]